ncbi:hypothetical protein [Streptomyces katsurahamanus]|uniref:Uncharacterized protein n=1 Tax=Streptomyces katsurahamanus TaxID=2577098 RepID=A0ABW9NWR8_9ACTN|nr:hypothetical protein [Streptomyces katsurahamanus]MQS37723.1 hypothetical protein [Streptomyces katsurahamanus]
MIFLRSAPSVPHPAAALAGDESSAALAVPSGRSAVGCAAWRALTSRRLGVFRQANGDNGDDELYGYVRVTSSDGHGHNLANLYWRNDNDDYDDSGHAELNVPNTGFHRGPEKDYWTPCGNGRCGIDAMIVDADGSQWMDTDEIDVNGSIVSDARHDGAGSFSRDVEGATGKARLHYTVRSCRQSC